MTLFAAGLVLGLAGGSLGTLLGVRRGWRLPTLRHRRGSSIIDLRLTGEELQEIDRADAESEYRNRRQALDLHLAAYADELAGDDELLRQRLRRFEAGEAS